MLGWILERWDGVMWTELVWLRIGTGGELLWIRYWTLGFHKILGNYRVALTTGSLSSSAQFHSKLVVVSWNIFYHCFHYNTNFRYLNAPEPNFTFSHSGAMSRHPILCFPQQEEFTFGDQSGSVVFKYGNSANHWSPWSLNDGRNE
jgi:hypothetical protein